MAEDQGGVAPHQDEDLVTVLTADHRDVERTLQEFDSSDSREEQRRLIGRAVVELVRLSVAEEQYVYPAAREKLPDGDEIAERRANRNSEDEALMKRATETPPDDPRFQELARKVISNARERIEEDATTLLPRLRQACTSAELQDLGKKVQIAKSSAPTHPHPAAPDTSPINLVSDPGIGLVDRMRDWFRGNHTPSEGG